MRRQNQMDNELSGYIDWICKAGKFISNILNILIIIIIIIKIEEAILTEEKTTELERKHIMDSKLKLCFKFKIS